MSGALHLDDWVTACEEGLKEVAEQALSATEFQLLERQAKPPTGLSGSYIALVAPEDQVQIGIAADGPGCQALARALLMMEDDGTELPSSDVADAIGEIGNILAGTVKRIVAGRLSSVTLGLPVFIHGRIEPTDKLDTVVSHVSIGPIRAALLVVRHKEHAKS